MENKKAQALAQAVELLEELQRKKIVRAWLGCYIELGSDLAKAQADELAECADYVSYDYECSRYYVTTDDSQEPIGFDSAEDLAELLKEYA